MPPITPPILGISITPHDVLSIVSAEFRIPVEYIGIRERNAKNVEPRRLFVWAMVTLLGCSAAHAGSVVNIDHSTVVYHIRKVDELCHTDVSYNNIVTRISDKIRTFKPLPHTPYTMRHIAFNPLQCIELIAKNDATPAQAVNEAIIFCQDNNIAQCNLVYRGFTFNIEPTSDLRRKLEMYNYYKRTTSNTTKQKSNE